MKYQLAKGLCRRTKKTKLSQVLYCLEHESNLSCWRRPSKQCLRHEGSAHHVQAMGEQKLIQDLEVQKIKKIKKIKKKKAEMQ